MLFLTPGWSDEAVGLRADVMQQIMEGRGKMPSFKDSIDPEQAWKIIACVRSLYTGSPEKVTW